MRKYGWTVPQHRVWINKNPYLPTGALFGFAFLLLAERPELLNHPHWQILIKEVAFAILIASLFSGSIEKYQREEFVKLVNHERQFLKEDIFLYAYGHSLPDQIREQVKVSLLEEPFYRQDLRIEWEFSSIEGTSEFVELKKEFTYTLVNTTEELLKDTFRFTQIGASEEEVLRETEFFWLRIERDGKVDSFGQGEMKEDRAGHRRRLAREIEVGPRKSVMIHYAFREPRRRKYADDNYAPRQAVVGKTEIRVRINPPLKLLVSAALRTEELPVGLEHHPPERYHWVLNKGLLPYQGLTLSWSPIPEKARDATKQQATINPSGSIPPAIG